ncbi:DUF255 domain-containing protein [Aestuariibaculum sp. YM273]|uniref:thioredoxin family protein n=1 Tax=Aestuariibaculum sp. YM273 TaxID=3070659 RepID=UPI0027DC6950|nr:thioredoxin fold domain-containing protein [Aestuariibaculum sp. YM273]WMI64130.1 DUF255 domain-containing protein [Aestuariibaculum sp. YM273]
MMKNIIKNIVVLIALSVSNSTFSQTHFVKESWENVLDIAKKENKLIFVDLYFNGCFPCKQMDDKIFPDPKVAMVLNEAFVAFKSDIFKEDIGKRISRKYGVALYPSFIVLDSTGNTLEVTSGYHTVEQFIGLLNKAKEKAVSKEFKSYSVGLEGDYPEFFSDAYLKNKRNVTFDVVDMYLKSQSNLSAEIPFAVITGLKVGGEYADYVIDHAKDLTEAYGRVPVRNYIAHIVNNKAKRFGAEQNQEAFEGLLKKVKPSFTNQEWEKFNASFQKKFKTN